MSGFDPYKHLTSENIFVFYLGDDYGVGNLISSPLRSDSSPSFQVKRSKESGELYWKDWGLEYGDFRHDSVGLVEALYDISREEACEKIKHDIIEGKVDKSTLIRPREPIQVPYDFYKRCMTPTEYLYWDNQCVSRKTLHRCNVHALKGLYKLDSKIMESTEGEPKFLYLFSSRPKSCKVYAPKSGIWNKWRSQAGPNGGDRIECEDGLPWNARDLVIESSTKDSMTAIECGVASGAPTSENSFKALLARKRELDGRFTNIHICFDNDAAGKKAAKRLKQLTDWNIINWEGTKDKSDLVKRVGNLMPVRDFFRRNNITVN